MSYDGIYLDIVIVGSHKHTKHHLISYDGTCPSCGVIWCHMMISCCIIKTNRKDLLTHCQSHFAVINCNIVSCDVMWRQLTSHDVPHKMIFLISYDISWPINVLWCHMMSYDVTWHTYTLHLLTSYDVIWRLTSYDVRSYLQMPLPHIVEILSGVMS